MLAAAALALAACHAPPRPAHPAHPAPAAARPTGAQPARAPASDTAECSSLQQVLTDALAASPDAAFDLAASYDTLMAQNAALAKSGGALVALRDRLAHTAPLLATRTNDFAQTTHYLAYLTASLAGAKHFHLQDLSFYEHGLFLGVRDRELARRAALAHCHDDGSRDQSDAWKKDAFARIDTIRPRLAPCLTTEPGRAVDLHVKVHVDARGHVPVAGRDAPYGDPASGIDLARAACIVRVLEQVTFPPPQGIAVFVMPFVHAATP